jgi:hypothetical protein
MQQTKSVFYAVCAEILYAGHLVRVELARVKAGSNTSTVTLRVVGGDEKGNLGSETVKYGHEFHGTRIRK